MTKRGIMRRKLARAGNDARRNIVIAELMAEFKRQMEKLKALGVKL